MTRQSTLTHHSRRRSRTFVLAVACCGIAIAVLPRAALADPVVLAVGDVACDPSDPNFNAGNGTATACRQKATSDLIVGQAFDAVLALGDQQYETGAFSAYQTVYDPTWGRFKATTYPIIGNHDGEAATSGDGYCQYFGAIAHCNATGQQGGAAFYSFDLGTWHIVMLNSNCIAVGGCGPGSPEYTWLQSDLAANPRSCTLAAWHHPRWSSGLGYNGSMMQPLWNLFYESGGDLVLSGHLHTYERFAPLNGAGVIDPTNGMRQFVVGTGGESFHDFGVTAPGSEVRQNSTFGVLRLVLHPASYDWTFLPIAGSTFPDSGSQACRADTTPPSAATGLQATANSPTEVDLSWAPSADIVGVTGYDVLRGPTAATLTRIASTPRTSFADTAVTAGQSYVYAVQARDAAGNMSGLSNVVTVVTPTPQQAVDQAGGAQQTGGQATGGHPAAHQSAKRLAHWRVKAASARRALARGRIRIPARRWAPTVIKVHVGGRLAVVRSTSNKGALTLKLPSWAKGSRYRHRTVTITIIQPARTAGATH
ncbi:metallophosphoesterase [Candidatus Solirubrobacter pratensis]|uniref:metallophosphoesterase n=1 Tax=Candidatus Solirubrobacter pratensis TaxID=1298857 RepID=UPI00041B735E|nr:metallophosphoesterase [Candidatus Solirubrobacter pratensis]